MIFYSPKGLTVNQWFAEIRRIKKLRGMGPGSKRRKTWGFRDNSNMTGTFSFNPLAFLAGLFTWQIFRTRARSFLFHVPKA